MFFVLFCFLHVICDRLRKIVRYINWILTSSSKGAEVGKAADAVREEFLDLFWMCTSASTSSVHSTYIITTQHTHPVYLLQQYLHLLMQIVASDCLHSTYQ